MHIHKNTHTHTHRTLEVPILQGLNSITVRCCTKHFNSPGGWTVPTLESDLDSVDAQLLMQGTMVVRKNEREREREREKGNRKLL